MSPLGALDEGRELVEGSPRLVHRVSKRTFGDLKPRTPGRLWLAD